MVTVGQEPPHDILQLTYAFRFPGGGDVIVPDWGQLSTKVGTFRIVRLDDATGQTMLAAFRHDEPVALLKIHDARSESDDQLPHLAIGKTSVIQNLRGGGIMPALIELWVVRSGEPLLSDNRQSREAYRMWTAMTCRTTKVEIRLW